MLNVIGLSGDGVETSINNLSHGLMPFLDETIGVYADISKNSVLLLCAAIKIGQRIAICPLREPQHVLNQWLNSLKIKTLITSNIKPLDLDPHIACFTVDELLTSSKDASATTSTFSTILRTSGTTGSPKCALISAAAHRASALSVNAYFNFTKNSTWGLNLPLYHVSGLSILFRAIESGGAIYVAKSHDELVAGLAQKMITHLSLVPAQLKRLLDEKIDLTSLSAVIIGGDALLPKLAKRARAQSVPLFETYGLTETASMIWVRNHQEDDGGFLLPHADMKIATDNELLVAAKSLFSGYVHDDGRIDPATIDGFFPTGDIKNRDLQPFIEGRKCNRIISGGENIQVEEIEAVLDAHPAIATSIVIGVKDTDFGMRPYAYINWRKDPVIEEELRTYLKERIAPFKIPKKFLPWPQHVPSTLKKPRAWFWSLDHYNKASEL